MVTEPTGRITAFLNSLGSSAEVAPIKNYINSGSNTSEQLDRILLLEAELGPNTNLANPTIVQRAVEIVKQLEEVPKKSFRNQF